MYYERLDVWKRSFQLSLLVYRSFYLLKYFSLKESNVSLLGFNSK